MIAIAEPIDADVLRARNEFLTRPSLQASAQTLAEILDISARHALVVLESLMREGFLERTTDDRYGRRQMEENAETQIIAGTPALTFGITAAAPQRREKTCVR